MKGQNMTAAEVLALLAQKHAGDVFVPECKDGPTQTRNHRRLDAWVLKRTWSPISTIGYEIKVSRSDFIGDDKWPAYLPLCHQFYFVTPHGLVAPSEVPAGAGLLWATKQGRLLLTKVKAPRRDIELPAELLVYVLMCRAAIGVDRGDHGPRETNVEHWQRWLAEKAEKQALGYRVSQRISEIVHAREREAQRSRELVETYETTRARIRELGFDPDASLSSWAIARKLDSLGGRPPEELARSLRRVAEKCAEAADEIDPKPADAEAA